eukprot:s363_g38.t1
MLPNSQKQGHSWALLGCDWKQGASAVAAADAGVVSELELMTTVLSQLTQSIQRGSISLIHLCLKLASSCVEEMPWQARVEQSDQCWIHWRTHGPCLKVPSNREAKRGSISSMIIFLSIFLVPIPEQVEEAERAVASSDTCPAEESDDAPSVDVDRQYVVQYINQSQAGFFMKGVRITGFEVQKMMYYFAALTFTLVSRCTDPEQSTVVFRLRNTKDLHPYDSESNSWQPCEVWGTPAVPSVPLTSCRRHRNRKVVTVVGCHRYVGGFHK